MQPRHLLAFFALALSACGTPPVSFDDAATADASDSTTARSDGSDTPNIDAPHADVPFDTVGIDVPEGGVIDSGSDARTDTASDVHVDAFACRRDLDCSATTGTHHCNPATGTCVQCVPFGDDCPTGSYCSPGFTCLPGCRDATDCVSGDGGMACDVSMHVCVGCTSDSNCAAGTICTGGACVPGCNTGHPCGTGSTCCTGVCLATSTDPMHCGTCTHVCGTTNAAPACVAGVCQEHCTTGFGDCDGDPTNGCETDVSANSSNCGACGAICRVSNATAMCASSMCNIVMCTPGFRDCDHVAATGCESNPMTDVMNCGACGTVCPAAQVCTAGVCACPTGTSPCPGSCLNLQRDVMNCGACGLVCPLGDACVAGACTVAPLYHGWTSPIAGCLTTTYNTTAPTALGGTYPFITGDTPACRAWKLAATVCTTQPTMYTDTNNWMCPASGGFTDPVFGTYCTGTGTQYSCSTCPGLCNAGACSHMPLSLRNCSGIETTQL